MVNRRSRAARFLAALAATALAATALAVVLVAGPVRAQDIPQLDSAITDQTGLLADDLTEIEDALERVFGETGVQIYVLFVQTTDGLDIGEYASLVGEQNLGDTDALLTVAVQDRTDDISIGSELRNEVSQVELDRVRTEVLEPGLASGDFGAAVIETADALIEVFPEAGPVITPAPPVTPGPPATPAPQPTPGQPAGGGSGNTLLLILGVGLIVAGGVWLLRRVRRLRDERKAAFEEAKTQEQLGREANKLLIETDDALRNAEQELGFAEAEFGADQARPLRDALAAAKEELSAAFTIGQELDDTIPEPPEKRRQMIEEIIARCQKARAAIDAQASELAGLRDLERNAPQVLDRLSAEADRLEKRLADSAVVTTRLARYAEGNSESVAGNLDTARETVAHARTRLDAGRQALAGTERAEAAVAAREAQTALEDALVLLDGLAHLADSLDETATKLKAELAAASQDVEAARREVDGGRAEGLAATLAEAETALAEARRESDAARPDVVTAYRRAADANRLADDVLAGARDEEEKRQRSEQKATSAIAAAEANIARAGDFIAAHRRSQRIGRTARNRLVVAQGHLDQARALFDQDYGRALEEAQTADRFADEAYALAQQEPPSYDPFDPSTVRPDTDFGSLVIGAILDSVLRGGGGRGGGGWSAGAPSRPSGGGSDWGGSGRGRSSSGDFDFGGFGSGGFGSGGFGSGGSGGSSGGGSFGGGRSSSGRW